MSYSNNISGNRAHPRKRLYSRVMMTKAGGETNAEFTINYSKSGIAILADQAFDIGDVYELEFKIKKQSGEKEYKVKAEVVQSYYEGEYHVSGFRFENELTLH